MAAIVVDDLVVRYGDLRAVDGVSFAVEPGEVVAILGPNGAGKTTTVETAEGYLRPDDGSVRVLGLDPVTEHDRLMPRVGVMLQGGGVYPGIRPPEILRLFAAYHDQPADPAALLERVGLTGRAHATWKQLSGGEQQRLSFALALVGHPEVLFLDEPTAGVDVGGRQTIRQLVREQRERGVAVLLTTHELDEAERVADRIVIVDHGKVVASGTPTELSRAAGDEIRFGAPPGLDVAALSNRVGATVVEAEHGEYVVAAAPSPATVAAITAWLAERDLPLADLRAGRQRLEDVFLRLTQPDDGA
jgi:ABC-2 type transport system ATP-binding protein